MKEMLYDRLSHTLNIKEKLSDRRYHTLTEGVQERKLGLSKKTQHYTLCESIGPVYMESYRLCIDIIILDLHTRHESLGSSISMQ